MEDATILFDKELQSAAELGFSRMIHHGGNSLIT
jgi:hypothetical protein